MTESTENNLNKLLRCENYAPNSWILEKINIKWTSRQQCETGIEIRVLSNGIEIVFTSDMAADFLRKFSWLYSAEIDEWLTKAEALK